MSQLKRREPARSVTRREPTRSVTFRVSEELYERLEAVAYAEARDEIGVTATTDDVNMSEYLRYLVEEFVQVAENNKDYGGDRQFLREQLRTAKKAALLNQLKAVQV